MDNIFQIGGQVTGESFIGREAIVNSLRDKYIDSKMRTSKSIVGLTRIGKSSVIKNTFISIPDNIIYVYEDLNEWSSYNELWQDICLEIKGQLYKTGVTSEPIRYSFDNIESENIPWIKLSRSIKKIFLYLADNGIKTILVLDEFDNATALFCEGTKHFELFRTIFSDSKYNVSALTISRRNLYSIEGATYQSSTFHGVMDVIPFKGFDDHDMEEYFEKFNLYDLQLTDDQKRKVIYYAGNAPFLLCILGHYIVETKKEGIEIDIDQIFLNKCKSINDYYRDCLKHLERDDDLKRIIPFIIGPNIGVTKNDKDELFNLGYFREDNGNLVVISEYFNAFITANALQVNIWDNIIGLEKKLKQLIDRELTRVVKHYSAGGNNINEIFRVIMEKTPGIERGDVSRYDAFISNNKKVFNLDSSYLDVISMSDAIKIIKNCWDDIFSAYFNNDLYSEWEVKLNKCSKARNPIAHGHEEYLSDLDKQEVDTYCKQIFDILSETIKTVTPDPTPFLEAADKFTEEMPIFSLIAPSKDLVGNTVDMLITDVGGTGKKNLKGVINERYRAFIPKNYLVGVELYPKINHRVKVKIEKIEGDRYEAIPISWYEE